MLYSAPCRENGLYQRFLPLWPGLRRAGLPRLSPAQEPGQRRRRMLC